MAVLGVDLSTRKVSFVFVGNDESICFQDEREVKGRLAGDRFEELTHYVGRVLDLWGRGDLGTVAACRVIIEGVPYVKSRRGAVGLAKVLGMVEALALRNGYEVEVVGGHGWKKALGLSGNANKDAIRAFAEGEGYISESQDLTDAFCIALSGVREDNEDD